MKTAVEGWQVMAKGLGSVTEMLILGISPWCFTPEIYAAKPDYIRSLAAFVRVRPAQRLEAFLRQSHPVICHDVEPYLGKITAPTRITLGRHDLLTSTSFADRMRSNIPGAEFVVFEGWAHAPIYEKVEEFNQKTLRFLRERSG